MNVLPLAEDEQVKAVYRTRNYDENKFTIMATRKGVVKKTEFAAYNTKLRADGIDDSLAVFGRPALEKIARGFDLRGHEIRDVSVIPKLFADFAAQGESEIWNIQISDRITAPVMRQTVKRGHGNM